MLNPEIYPMGLGKILSNLLSLEFILRLFVMESEQKSLGSLDDILATSEGDWVQETPLTNYDSLKDIVNRSNQLLEKLGVEHRVNVSLIDLRDTLAHGRMLTYHPELPLKLVKFSKAVGGKVMVRQSVAITPEWIKEQVGMIRSEMDKMMPFIRAVGTPVSQSPQN